MLCGILHAPVLVQRFFITQSGGENGKWAHPNGAYRFPGPGPHRTLFSLAEWLPHYHETLEIPLRVATLCISLLRVVSRWSATQPLVFQAVKRFFVDSEGCFRDAEVAGSNPVAPT